MKKTILFIALAMLLQTASTVEAQNAIINLQGYNERPYHFGFILGMNTMNFSIKPVEGLTQRQWTKEQAPDLPNADAFQVLSVTSGGSPGFSVGILGSLRVVKLLDLRFIPSLSFGSRTLDYKIRAFNMVGTPAGSDSVFMVNKKVNSTYVTFPLLLKYRSWRKDNYGAYFIGGMSYAIDLAAIKKSKNDSGNGDIMLKKHDINAEIGAGFDFYNAFFKLSIEAKMVFGLNNLMVHDNTLYSESINQLHSKIFMLSFTFE